MKGAGRDPPRLSHSSWAVNQESHQYGEVERRKLSKCGGNWRKVNLFIRLLHVSTLSTKARPEASPRDALCSEAGTSFSSHNCEVLISTSRHNSAKTLRVFSRATVWVMLSEWVSCSSPYPPPPKEHENFWRNVTLCFCLLPVFWKCRGCSCRVHQANGISSSSTRTRHRLAESLWILHEWSVAKAMGKS